jgi:type III secretory pathway component EscR
MEVFLTLIIYIVLFAIIFYVVKYILGLLEVPPKFINAIVALMLVCFLIWLLGVLFGGPFFPRYPFK